MNTTIIIPTYNEAENIPELVTRIKAAIKGKPRILIVDDSPGIKTAAVALANGCHVIKRTHDRGLAQSVMAGIKSEQTKDCLIVMDADLQHPPEILPKILKELESHDFVIASRYTKNGSCKEWGAGRKIISKCANWLARPLMKFKVKDMMSGYAGFRTDGLPDLAVIKPRGYKVLTELMVRGNWQSIAEIPYVFEARKSGKSKLSRIQIFDYLKQLASLYLYRFRFINFCLVGSSGIFINMIFLWGFTELLKMPYMISALIASLSSITNNYIWNYLWTFRDMKTKIVPGFIKYLAMAGIASIAYLGLLALFTETMNIWYMASAGIAIFITFTMRYYIAKRWIWTE